mmetsp:Transcript_154405/g.495122  ORF Transcript_154405/g.495122 Transcript_154405/m.495122 type:complete len:233 (-) Transcript_154405:200-898(-)
MDEHGVDSKLAARPDVLHGILEHDGSFRHNTHNSQHLLEGGPLGLAGRQYILHRKDMVVCEILADAKVLQTPDRVRPRSVSECNELHLGLLLQRAHHVDELGVFLDVLGKVTIVCPIRAQLLLPEWNRQAPLLGGNLEALQGRVIALDILAPQCHRLCLALKAQPLHHESLGDVAHAVVREAATGRIECVVDVENDGVHLDALQSPAARRCGGKAPGDGPPTGMPGCPSEAH